MIPLRRNRIHRDGDLSHFADGRVWRLTRGRDFHGSARDFRKSAQTAADQMGKVVRIVHDKLEPEKHVWVQFGDGRISVGDPCACGSTAVARVHRTWARCAACGALLEIVPRASDDQREQPQEASPASSRRDQVPRTALDEFADVALFRHSVSRTNERCFGRGLIADGRSALLIVDFPLEEGQRVPHPDVAGQWYYKLRLLPGQPFAHALDLSRLERGEPVSWKIDEDPGPDLPERLEPPLG